MIVNETSDVERIVMLPEELTEQLAKAILAQHTLSDDDWCIASEAWGLICLALINPEKMQHNTGINARS